MATDSSSKAHPTRSVGRLISIVRTLLRFNLLELVPDNSLPRLVRYPLRFIKLFSSNDSRPIEQRIRLALESLGPIYIKFGQLLSTRRDMLNPALADELAKLQDDVPPFSNEIAVEIIERSLGKPLLSAFKSIDAQPLASASVAQVYRARLPNEHQVIIKVIRPGIDKILSLIHI